MFSKSRSAPRAPLRAFLFQPANLSVRRRSTHRHHNAPVFLTLTVRSSATKEQLRLGYFGVRFRTKKYAVSYFSAESEAIALRPTEKRPQVQERGTWPRI